MKKQYQFFLIVAVLAFFSTACSHVAPRYNASATNVEKIHQISKETTNKVSVGEFTATEVGKNRLYVVLRDRSDRATTKHLINILKMQYLMN